MLPKPGDVVRVGREASVQFVEPILFRVIKADGDTYDGWCWLTGIQIDQWGDAVGERRELFVQPAGLRLVPPSPIAERMANAARLMAVPGGKHVNEHARPRPGSGMTKRPPTSPARAGRGAPGRTG